MDKEKGNKTGKDQRWGKPNVLEESEEAWVTRGEDVCRGTVKATLNEESEESDRRLQKAWKRQQFHHTWLEFIFLNYFSHPQFNL